MFRKELFLLIGSANDHISDQASGLYVFRPIGIDPPRPIDIKHFYCYKVRLK